MDIKYFLKHFCTLAAFIRTNYNLISAWIVQDGQIRQKCSNHELAPTSTIPTNMICPPPKHEKSFRNLFFFLMPYQRWMLLDREEKDVCETVLKTLLCWQQCVELEWDFVEKINSCNTSELHLSVLGSEVKNHTQRSVRYCKLTNKHNHHYPLFIS